MANRPHMAQRPVRRRAIASATMPRIADLAVAAW
jgi:hypothetical protein